MHTRCTVPAVDETETVLRRKWTLKVGCSDSSTSFPNGDPKLVPSSARIQPASPKIHRFTNGNSNKHSDKLLHSRTAPARPQHIPCYNNNHMLASYIPVPIGHRLLIRLVMAHISISRHGKTPLSWRWPLNTAWYQANSSILLIGLQKVHQITKNNTQHGFVLKLGFTLQNSPNMAIFMAKMMTNNRWIF